jgi:hypothetical protein
MFSIYHIIRLIISFALIVFGVVYLKRTNPPLKKFLSFACIVAVISEIIKTFSVITLVPSSTGLHNYIYLELEHVPLHLCSIQIILLFYVRFAKEGPFRDIILAFMYPTCAIGATLSLLIPTIFIDIYDPSQAFTHPHPYQYFLYHVMLIILGIYILISKQVDLKPKHYLTTMGVLGTFAFASLYFNSMVASPRYIDGELVSVDYAGNFLFTYAPPIDIPLTELWHWYLYLGIIISLAFGLIALFYIPVFKRNKK